MKVTFTIRRPEGHTENVDVSANFSAMNDTMFENIRKAAAAAGKDEPISYKVECALTAEQLAEINADNERSRWMNLHSCNAR